ncbi:MAG: HAMP domain-containing protein [Candidatus Parcubacteria bacterium]|nr:HAMP domain-containing protein [Candidatus Parcubacteria bacterium]
MFKNLKIKTKIIIGFLLINIPLLLIGFFVIQKVYQSPEPIDGTIQKSMTDLSKATRLSTIAQSIRYYDEFFTQSMRDYAYTQDRKWRDRYVSDTTTGDALVTEAVNSGDAQDKEIFAKINDANMAMITMEEDAMLLVDNKRAPEAIKILESPEYAKQKEIYKNGLDEYAKLHNQEYEVAKYASDVALENATVINRNTEKANITFMVIAFGFCFLFGLIMDILFAFFVTKPLKELEKTVKTIASGDESARSLIWSKDEIGEMAQALNQMADNLQKSKANVEEKVAERTSELEKLNTFMSNREIKMAELKKEIEDLKKKQTNT